MKKCCNLMKWMVIRVLVVSLSVVIASVPGKVAADDSVIHSQPAILETISPEGFVHPSVGFTGNALKLMQEKVAIGAEPWASAFEEFRTSPSGSLDYDIRNQSKLDKTKPAYTKIDNDAKAKEAKVDAEAAFTDAVIWAATGDVRYREKAMTIVRLWSQIDPANPKGFTDSHISIGDAMANMVRAAELLRYTESSGEWAWTDEDTTNFTQNYLMAFYDGNFYHNNGRWMNQHGIITQAYMMAAVFSDNQQWYQEAVEWATANKTATFKGQSGDIFHQIRYVTQNERTGAPVEPHVQLVEMFRDMGHASGNTATLSMIAYMAEIQGTKVNPDMASPTFGEVTNAADGVGMFEFLDNRILAGANELARYNLGYDILYTPVNISNAVIGDPAGNYADTVSDNGRGLGYASEVTYGYYMHHMAQPMDPDDERIKYLAQAIEKQGGLETIPSYVLLQGTKDLATGEVVGPPKPLSNPPYTEVKAAYDRLQAFDYIGRSATTSTSTFQDLDGMRSVLYDVRYENQYTWYDLDLDDSYNEITIRAASNSSVGTKVDVILLDGVDGLDHTNVTTADLAKGEVLTTLQVPNTGWWTNYATVSGKLSKPLSGKHLIAFKYYGSANWLSYQIAFDWFAFSDSYAGNEHAALSGVLSGGATETSDGVKLNDGGEISFSKMNFDSGNNSIELQAKTTDAAGQLLLYSGETLVSTYKLPNTSNAMVKFTSEVAAADLAKIKGIHDITLKYKGSSPITVKSYRNIERNRLANVDTSGSQANSIADQAISISGAFEVGKEGRRSYIQTKNGSLVYLSKAALQVDRTKDSIVSFTVRTNGEATLQLQRDSSTAPFATIRVPDTNGEWLRVSTNISDQYVKPDDYPTYVKSLFVSIMTNMEDTEVMLDSYTLDPADTPPVIRLKSEQGFELTSVAAYENGADMNLKVSVEDPDSVNVSLSTDNQAYIDSSGLNRKAGGTLIVKPAGLAPGEYVFHIYAEDDTSNYVDKEVKLTIYPEEENKAPEGLTATLTGPNSVLLNWQEVKGATYYAIYRKQGSAGTYTKWKETTSTEWTDADLKSGTLYAYQVAGGGNAGETAKSEAVSTTTLSAIQVTESMVKASSKQWDASDSTGIGTPESNGWRAFDGNTETAPDALTNPSWILIDLGQNNAPILSGVKFYPRSTHLNRMKDAVIQGSNDGTTFENLYTVGTISTAKWYFAGIMNDKGYRYLRYYTPKGNANVAELEFYQKVVHVDEPNQAPMFADLAPVTVTAGQEVKQTLIATDPEGDSITYAGIDLPAGAKLDTATGEFSWTPEVAGSYVLHFKASDAKGAATAVIWTITVKEIAEPQPETENSATLRGPLTAAPGQSVDLNIGVHGVTDGFTTAQLTVTYDTYKLQFPTTEDEQGHIILGDEAVTSSEEGLQIIGTGVRPESGEILLIVANTNQNQITNSGDLIALHGQVKADATTGQAQVSLSDFEVSADGNSNMLDTSTASIAIQIQVDKTQLTAAIQSAQSLHATAVEGSDIGQYPIGSKNIFDASIQSAVTVRDNSGTTQAEVNTAVTALQSAITTFRNSVHTATPQPTDHTALTGQIQSVQGKLAKAVAGTKIGQYPQQAITRLQTVLNAAIEVKNNNSASQANVDAAVAQLQSAVNTFASQLITLISGQIHVSIKDLSLIAKYYGTKSTDAGWNVIEKADLFDGGEITIRELAAVAQMIVGDWLEK
ncbi:carbohydrate-binding protein [Paenibacillus sp. LS1]|uniref:carbohydrate-binding protein n=1 Tax=Paenibacillus sp. LS1 TaxID=2992120 RepID=UPI0022304DF5|nr:carbohydrate-binding protein [Paenibacillus sp. LS1]MCW3790214.1 carbohydrate-binding protein [Paenibacillus sp. LS1]